MVQNTHRIKHTYGAPYTPNQTLVEGVWHVLASIVRSDMLHAGGDQRLFPYYFLQASRIWNVLKHAGADVSPLEFLTGKRQSLAAFRPGVPGYLFQPITNHLFIPC